MPESSRQSSPPQQAHSFGSRDPFAQFAPQINVQRMVEINDLIHRGQKISAIKLFRETFNVGLKEAKEAVERLERGEAINLAGQQRIMAFHDADVQNQWYGTMDRGEMVINVGTTGNVVGQPFAGSQAFERPKRGCLAAFIGQFGCLLFSFFWIAFVVMMVGTFISTDLVELTAPLVCEEGYQDAVAERVSYYATDNYTGENVIILHCIYETGSQETVHPMLVTGVMFAVPMAILAVVAFGLAFLGRIGAIISP